MLLFQLDFVKERAFALAKNTIERDFGYRVDAKEFHFRGPFHCRLKGCTVKNRFETIADIDEFEVWLLASSLFHTQLDITLKGIVGCVHFKGDLHYDMESEKISSSIDGRVEEFFNDPLFFNVLVKGDVHCPTVAISAHQAKLQMAHLSIENMTLTLESFPLSKQMETEMSLTGVIDDLPFTIVGTLQLEQGSLLKVDNLSLKMEQFTSSGTLFYNLTDRHLDANLNLATDDITESIPNTELLFKGHLFAKCNVTADLSDTFSFLDTKIHLNVHSNQCSIGQAIINDLSFEYDQTPSWSCANLKIPRLILQGNDLGPLEFSLDLFDDYPSPFHIKVGEFTAAGTINSSLQLYLEEAKGHVFGKTVALQSGAHFQYADEKLHLQMAELLFGTSRFTLSGYLSPEQINVHLDPLTLSLADISDEFDGSIFGHFDLFGTLDKIEGRGSLQVSQFTPKGYPAEKLFPAKGEIDLEIKGRTLVGHAHLEGAGNEGIDLEMRLPLTLSLQEVSIPADQPLEVQANVNGEISPFLHFLLTDTTSATGHGELKLNIGGTINHPQFFGTLKIEMGRYESLDMGCIISQVEGEMVLDGNCLTLHHLVGYDAQGGTIRGEGKMLLDHEKRYPFEILLQPQKALLLKLDYAEAKATGNVLLKGDIDQAILEGELAVSDTLITLPDETPALLNTIEVEYINQPENERPPTCYQQTSDAWPVALNLQIQIQSPARVVSTNFKSTWRGLLELKGTTDAPLIYGQGKIVQGSFTFNGKELASNEGMIYFAGEPSRKTTLYIVAREEIDNLKIEVVVKGPIRSPELAFHSNPPKTTREILSYLLFNRGLGNISPLEGDELTQNIIKLNENQDSGPNLFDKLRQSIGIDRLELTSQQGGDPDDVSLKVGKYLSKQFLLSVKKSMSDKPNQAAIEADLTSNFKAEAEVGDDAQGRMILKWERDY